MTILSFKLVKEDFSEKTALKQVRKEPVVVSREGSETIDIPPRLRGKSIKPVSRNEQEKWKVHRNERELTLGLVDL